VLEIGILEEERFYREGLRSLNDWGVQVEGLEALFLIVILARAGLTAGRSEVAP
jgi:hypothetical protein